MNENSVTVKLSETIPDYRFTYRAGVGFSPGAYYIALFGTVPSTREFFSIDPDKARKLLCEHFNASLIQSINDDEIQHQTGEVELRSYSIPLCDGLMIYFDTMSNSLTCFYDHRISGKIQETIKDILKSCERVAPPRGKLSLLVVDTEMGGFSLFEVKEQYSEVDISLNYCDDFQPVDEVICNKLLGVGNRGIVLLHGKPGTGKTSYIRHLIKKIPRNMIYIPSNIVPQLSAPELLRFLIRHEGSVLIIEDAESILEERHGGDSGALTNLLNLGDGLLSDCLKIQIICTFNAPLSRIDKALLRKGRLIASYEFGALSVEKSNRLLEHLDVGVRTDKELTLSEIYYMKELDFQNESSRKTIGF